MRSVGLACAAVAVALAAAGCGAASVQGFHARRGAVAGARHVQTTTVVTTRTVPGLGTVLANSSGHTLYLFAPDRHRRVTCTGTCTAVWPPLKLQGRTARAGGKARASLLGSDPSPEGGRVVTYKGWPLYTYVGDRKAGEAKGQGLNLNGGLWYVLAPSGRVIGKKAGHSSSGGGW